MREYFIFLCFIPAITAQLWLQPQQVHLSYSGVYNIHCVLVCVFTVLHISLIVFDAINFLVFCVLHLIFQRMVVEMCN